MDPQPGCVVVTGFGPFRQHLVNASWEAVKELSKLGLRGDLVVELRTLELPVDYREVKKRVTKIWEDIRPQLAVHVGVDTSTKVIILEQCGKNRGYRDADVRGFRPEGGVCLPDGPEVMESVVSMKAACKHIALEGVDVAFSRDAGRYICDYAYYLSLYLGNRCAVLVHVPPLSRCLSAPLLGEALQVIAGALLEQSSTAGAQSLAGRTPGHVDSDLGERPDIRSPSFVGWVQTPKETLDRRPLATSEHDRSHTPLGGDSGINRRSPGGSNNQGRGPQQMQAA